MALLIDVERLQKELDYLAKFVVVIDDVIGIKMAMNVVSSQPTIYVPDTNVGKWTPIKEGYPPRKEAYYWVTVKTENGYKVDRELYSFDNHGIPGFYTFSRIVAWMPYTLPEPYKGGEM